MQPTPEHSDVDHSPSDAPWSRPSGDGRCPDCDSDRVVRDGGCPLCLACGWSACAYRPV